MNTDLPALPEKLFYSDGPIWRHICAWESARPGRGAGNIADNIDTAITDAMHAYARECITARDAEIARLQAALAETGQRVNALATNERVLVDKLSAALAAQQPAEPDMRHPKIQALIGSNARRSIELSIAEDLLDDPEHEISGTDGDYWLPLHDKIVALQQRAAAPAVQPAAQQPAVPAGWRLETGTGGFGDKGNLWVSIRHLESQCGQDFYVDRDPLIFGFLSALAAAPAVQTPADTRKPCTCDGAGRGPGRACVVKAGGRLGELWRCAQGHEAKEQPAEAVAPKPEKTAPVQGWPQGIPWSLHLEAYAAYCKKWSPQPALIDLEDRNCRGGFGTEELDEFIPGWRDKVSEIGRLKAEVARLSAALAAPTAAPSAQPVAQFRTAKQAGVIAGDGKACPNDHDPDCRWPECNCRAAAPSAPQPSGHCTRGDGCVCGGDTVAVRAACRHWETETKGDAA